MVGAQAGGTCVIDVQFDMIAYLNRTRLDATDMHVQIAELLQRVADRELQFACSRYQACITDLATGMGVKGGLIIN